MAYAIVKSAIATVLKAPVQDTERDNEGLHGEIYEIVALLSGGWVKIRTLYGHEGYTRLEYLNTLEESVAAWRMAPKKVVNHYLADVLMGPTVQHACLLQLTKGCHVIPVGEPGDIWQKIQTAGGDAGYIRAKYLDTPLQGYDLSDEAGLRERILKTALSYMHTQYRWGGKSPLGIDCSGLCCMALMLNGIVLFNGMVMLNRINEAPPLHEIPLKDIKKADLLYWPGHVAMYMGEGRFVNSSGSKGGVCINSMDPGDPEYDGELVNRIIGAGSIF